MTYSRDVMGILLKFTLRNIKEHKFRTFLIVLSIMLSVALFFASFSISDALTEMIMDNIRAQIGTSEIMVTPSWQTNSQFVKLKDLGEHESKFDYQVGVMETSAKFKESDNRKSDVSLKGYDLGDLETMNPITYYDRGNIDNFTGKQVIIGKAFAEKHGYDIGENIRIIFSDEDVKYFKVAAIADDVGFFKQQSSMWGDSTITMITPVKTLQRFAGTINGYNFIYVKTKVDTQVDTNVDELKTVYSKDNVFKTITKSEIDSQIKPIKIPFMFMLILVVIISMFIIFTSFKVIMLERLPMLGTFRSIGATKKMTNTIMIAEGFIYGAVGSLLGVGIGIGILKLLMIAMTMGMGGSTLSYPKSNILIAIAFGLGLSLISSSIPIVKTTKIPVKEILLNIIEGTKRKRTYIRYIIGFILGVLSFTLPSILSQGMMAAASGALGIIFAIFSIICFVPLITDLILRVTEKLFGLAFGNLGILAAKNLKGNKSTYDNVILLTIGLTSVLAIGVLGASIEKETLKAFYDMKYDVSVDAWGVTKTTAQRIISVPGVEDYMMYDRSYEAYELPDKKEPFVKGILGVSSEKYSDFVKLDILNTDNDKEILKDLQIGRKMIVGNAVKDKYNLDVGSEIELKTPAGIKTYEIIGFIQTSDYNGSYAITSLKNFKYDLKMGYSMRMYIKTAPGADPENVKAAIETKLRDLDYHIRTKEQYKKDTMKENAGILIVLNAFSVATALIGSVGVMNNFLVSFLSRRKSLAVLSSVGMSKKQRKKMILIEAVAAGFIGAILGLISGGIVIKMVAALLEKIELVLDMSVPISLGVSSLIGAIFICLISSISVVRKSSKLSVIEELRYE